MARDSEDLKEVGLIDLAICFHFIDDHFGLPRASLCSSCAAAAVCVCVFIYAFMFSSRIATAPRVCVLPCDVCALSVALSLSRLSCLTMYSSIRILDRCADDGTSCGPQPRSPLPSGVSERAADVTDVVRIEAPAGRKADDTERDKLVHLELVEPERGHEVVQQVDGKVLRFGHRVL